MSPQQRIRREIVATILHQFARARAEGLTSAQAIVVVSHRHKVGAALVEALVSDVDQSGHA
jgi:hypothetical protein